MPNLGVSSLEQNQLFDPYEAQPVVHSDKEDLLIQMQPVFEPTVRIPVGTLFASIVGVLIVCAVLMPKIYLRNAIYYSSRDVTKLEHEYEILKKESELLKADVEAFRYKNQIEDTLF